MEADRAILLSIVIPTFNSSIYIKDTISEVYATLIDLNKPFEIIIVNDLSSDDTLFKCNGLKNRYNNLKILSLNKNLGQRLATTIGFEIAKGKYVVTFDDDLQNRPSDIVKLYNVIKRTEKKVITGYYSFKEESKSYKIIKQSIFFFLNALFFPKYSKSKFYTSFKILDKKYLDSINSNNIFHFWNIPHTEILPIKVDKLQRKKGSSNYNLKQFFRLFSHILIKILIKITFLLILLLFILLLLGVSQYMVVTITLLLTSYIILSLMLHFDKVRYKNIKNVYK